MKITIKHYLFNLLVLFYCNAFSQNPVKWNIEFNCNNQSIIFNAEIEDKWHLYAVYVPHSKLGPLPTEFSFEPSKIYNLKDTIIQMEPIIRFDKDYGIELAYYEKKTTFTQFIVNEGKRVKIKGNIKYMSCNENMCIPFEYPFKINTKCQD